MLGRGHRVVLVGLVAGSLLAHGALIAGAARPIHGQSPSVQWPVQDPSTGQNLSWAYLQHPKRLVAVMGGATQKFVIQGIRWTGWGTDHATARVANILV